LVSLILWVFSFLIKEILSKGIFDTDTLWLLGVVIASFYSMSPNETIDQIVDKGLPLGNLTSQLLVNVYMNEFDQFVKHKLKAKYYIRYADDFVMMSQDKNELANLLRYIAVFLKDKLKLDLHPDKVFIKTLASGVDFLGWVHFPRHRVLRTATKKRMFKRVEENPKPATVQSYFGLLKHGDGYKLKKQLLGQDVFLKMMRNDVD